MSERPGDSEGSQDRSRLLRPLQEFLATETSSAIVVLACAGLAFVWANIHPASYGQAWSTDLGGIALRDWVNDGAMTLFFFVVGLELKRELISGELRDRRTAALPVVAALGGMLVPAAIYLLLTPSEVSRGWGIPIATDIAFALAVLALAAGPPRMRVFLLTLAIADDIGAILVIAFVYGHGIHPSIVGVVLGLCIPRRFGPRLEHRLHPWSSYLVVPLFALANAGVVVRAATLGAPAAWAVFLGVFAGLVVGKAAGVWLATALGSRFGLGDAPGRPQAMAGLAVVTGIGFTVSLFVADLAFPGRPDLTDAAKLAVLCASAVAGVSGALILRSARARTRP